MQVVEVCESSSGDVVVLASESRPRCVDASEEQGA